MGADRQHRKRGRPKLAGGRSERIDVRVCTETYDALCRIAIRADISLAELLRDTLDRKAAPVILSVKNRQPAESSAP